MFALWAEMAARMSVRDVMRDVTLWAFTVDFFRKRMEELKEVEDAMTKLDMDLEAYLAQLNVIQRFDSSAKLGEVVEGGGVLGGLGEGEVMVLAGEEDILIPVVLSKELCEAVVGSVWKTSPGGHGCLVSRPSPELHDAEILTNSQWEFPDQFNQTVLEFLATIK
jgi:3-oxoadipate enol-lactonase